MLIPDISGHSIIYSFYFDDGGDSIDKKEAMRDEKSDYINSNWHRCNSNHRKLPTKSNLSIR